MNFSKYLGKKTLILGDVNTGKTFLCRTILEDMCRHGLSRQIGIIDLAPEIPETSQPRLGMKGVGGKLLAPAEEDVIYLSDSLVPPRLTSANEQEAIEKARQNASKCLSLFKQYRQLKRDILFINDISIFLQAGSLKAVMKLVASAGTVIANGYYGGKLGSGALSLRERKEMEALKKYFDILISL